jgi:probable rRNA maturation factor
VSSPGRVIAKLTVDVRGRARKIAKKEIVKDVAWHLRRVMHAASVATRACTLSFVDDDEIRALNKQYAGEDHATDVLSFEQDAPLLGDIVISVETAKQQADARNIDIADELLYLAVHAVAHLQGLDHRNKREEKVMFAYMQRLLEQAYSGYPTKRVEFPVSRPKRRKA